MTVCAQSSHRATWPPSAAVRQRSIALITFIWSRLTCPALALRHAAPWSRFGARTATAPVLIGLVFLVLGAGFGESGYAFLKTIPDAVLGGLLMFSGIEL